MASLRALECLVATVEEGSVTRAAERLNLSQPALSHQLAGLQREIGTPLLHRLPRGSSPTVAARAMLPDARAAVAAAAAAVRSGPAAAAGRSGRVRVGIAEGMTVPLLAPVLEGWLAGHVDVQVHVDERASADALTDSLLEGALDLVVAPRGAVEAPSVARLGREEILLALPHGHPLALQAADPTWEQLAGEPIVAPERGNGLRGWLDAQAAAHGVHLETVVQTRQAASAAQLAAAGLGVALVPATAVTGGFPGRLRRLSPALGRDIVASCLSEADGLVLSLREALLQQGIPSPRAPGADRPPED